jgi:hypothetical protein
VPEHFDLCDACDERVLSALGATALAMPKGSHYSEDDF